MSHHTPEDLRRILMLLKGKRRAGKALSRHVAKGGPPVGSLGALDEGAASSPELDRMLQLLDAGREAGMKLRARGVGR